VNSAINSGISAGFNFMMLFQLSRFMGGPVQFQAAQGSLRTRLINIADPLVPPTTNDIASAANYTRTYTIFYTYVTESGSETLPSPSVTITLPPNTLTTVAAPPPPGVDTQAIGWNCYVGQQSPALQNQQPLPFWSAVSYGGTPVPYLYTEPESLFQDYPYNQQTPPQSNTTGDNIAYINHLELQMPNGTWKPWNQNSLDSVMMRRFASVLPVATPYQSHAWDLVDGHNIEIRPAMGETETPQYFYIRCPRRLRYDQAEIPYQSIVGFIDFVRAHAIALLKLAVDEYLAQQAWDTKAASYKNDIIQSLLQQNWGKDARITPYNG
jgi:hypothetical protein